MTSTSAQKAADDALRAAIAQAMEAYEMTDDDRILTDFVVLTASHRFENDGDTTTKYDYLLPESGMPWHRLLGLIDVQRKLMYDNMDISEE